MCVDVAEYGVRSVLETTSAVVKLVFELSLVCKTREVEVLEFYEQGEDTSCAHSLVTKECVSEKGEVTSVEDGLDVERTTETVRVSA